MVDDMGYADLSCYGRKDYQTPALDAFVRQGMKFNHAYAAAPVCTPSRVAFMTGRIPARTDVGLREPLTLSRDDQTVGLSAQIPTVSSRLHEGGYETALFGKWHLGLKPEFRPGRHGFDHFFGITSASADYVDHKMVMHLAPETYIKRTLPNLYQDNEPVVKKGYLTDLITEEAVAFIRGVHRKPFFISLQYTAPHWPWQAPGDAALADSINQRAGSPQQYAQMVQNLDSNIGKVLKALDVAGLTQSTLIIFTSDNGGEQYSDMGPFKGKKMTLWEGGIRVPAAVRWPGVISAGSSSNQPVITMDWSATILEAAQIKPPNNWDGISLLAHLRGKAAVVPRTFYWRTANRVRADALRQGDWKYLRTSEGEFLFNLAQDPYETKDLKATHPDQFSTVKAAFIALDRQMLAPLILTNTTTATK